jgi:hypothetical protein
MYRGVGRKTLKVGFAAYRRFELKVPQKEM